MKIIIEVGEGKVFSDVETTPTTLTNIALAISELERIKAQLINRLNNVEPDLEWEE